MSTGRPAHRLAPVTAEVLVSVSQAVTRALREAILQGRLRPGERLVQDELAAELGVSRQPVREALRRLESEGLIVQLPQRGFAVREQREEDIRENYHLRRLLESEAARAAARCMRPEELEQLRALYRSQELAADEGDAAALVELNEQFHRLVHEASRMPQLVRLVRQLWAGRTVFTPLFVPGRAQRSLEEHRRLLAALERGDPAGAGVAMDEHIARAAEDYFRQGRALPQGGEPGWDGSWSTTPSGG